MTNEIYEATRSGSYCLWEATKCYNARAMWFCAEDIADYFERENILDHAALAAILRLGKGSPEYVDFVRHIAVRVYIYTRNPDALFNWYTSEHLLFNAEWQSAILRIASGLREQRGS